LKPPDAIVLLQTSQQTRITLEPMARNRVDREEIEGVALSTVPRVFTGVEKE
jgi:hypothetical protein